MFSNTRGSIAAGLWSRAGEIVHLLPVARLLGHAAAVAFQSELHALLVGRQLGVVPEERLANALDAGETVQSFPRQLRASIIRMNSVEPCARSTIASRFTVAPDWSVPVSSRTRWASDPSSV